MERRDPIDSLFQILLIIGGLNWGLVGLFNYDLVAALFGGDSVISRVIYILVGISALYVLLKFFRPRRTVTDL